MLDRILIIDDSDDMEQLVRFCAHSYWPSVILETYDPKCGIPEDTFRWNNYDLLLLDYELGLNEENGLDWLKQFKQEQPYLPPTFMITAYSGAGLKSASMRSGADGFLDKDSLTPQLFANEVKKILLKADEQAAQSDASDHDGKTRFLSPKERYAAMSQLRRVQEDADKNESYAKTRLMGRDDMAQLMGTLSQDPEAEIENSEEISNNGQNSNSEEISLVDDQRKLTTSARHITRSRTPAERRAQPILVPGYFVEKKIGEGGMAAIYLAEREEDQAKVVLKVLSLEGEKNTSLLRRFIREYKFIARIDHPNIVQIHERAFASDFAYIAMEYFPYGDLVERLKEDLDTKTALSFLKQIAAGLGAAHAQGIVHRDMKPTNILFRTRDVLAITDFGIAKAVESENRMRDELTMVSELVGTLYYVSPEQIEGAKADKRSDIYSLGIIMYKILTGEHPFAGNTPMEVFSGHLYGAIPRLPEKFSNLQPILDGLLAKDPDERFQDTEEVVMGIEWGGY